MTLFQQYILAMEKANELELQALIARKEADKLQKEYLQSVLANIKEEEDAANA